MWQQLPIKTRLALHFTGLLALVLAVSGVFLFSGFARQLDVVIDDEITSLAEEFVQDIGDGEHRDGEHDILHDFEISKPADLFSQIIDRSGTVIETTRGIAESVLGSSVLAKVAGTEIHETTLATIGRVRVGIAPAPDGTLVLVGKALAARNATLAGFLTLLLSFGPAVLIVVGGLGWLTARASLRPVEALRQQAARISEGDLDRRLPLPKTGDEIARLTGTLNEMLARLEAGIARERRIIDDASHELRTPLAVLQTELDLALRRSRTHAEMRAALESAAETSGRLNRLASDMLVLARANRGTLALHPTETDVAALVRTVAAVPEGCAREAGITLQIEVEDGLCASLDPERFRQALGNLLDNALFHCPSGGTVTVRAAVADSATLVVSVADTGPGFPAEFMARAFEPYTRAHAGRARRDGGAGLGLAIVKSIAEAHGGLAIAANRPHGGAVVSLILPQ